LSASTSTGTWSSWAIICNNPKGNSPVRGTHELGGEIRVSNGTVLQGGRIETLEATDNPAVVPYCGSITRAGASGSEAFFLVADTAYVAAAGGDVYAGNAFWTGGLRSGGNITFVSSTGGALGTASVVGDAVTGSYSAQNLTATLLATRCSDPDVSVCCGAGSATRCCFHATCPCP
jgi:hypothetical protein